VKFVNEGMQARQSLLANVLGRASKKLDFDRIFRGVALEWLSGCQNAKRCQGILAQPIQN
jgi:hypothetical protein